MLRNVVSLIRMLDHCDQVDGSGSRGDHKIGIKGICKDQDLLWVGDPKFGSQDPIQSSWQDLKARICLVTPFNLLAMINVISSLFFGNGMLQQVELQ